MKYISLLASLVIFHVFSLQLHAQNSVALFENGETSGVVRPDSAAFYRLVKSYVNPVLGGDHPDPTLLKVGDDFYMCGSTFHFNPYFPVLHSTDLVHWQEICRVVPSDWGELNSTKPGAGIWQGAITYFFGSYWVYFSNGNGGGQYFSKSASPKGPWSRPTKVKTTATTGPIGYDNSIFVDDDGTPYMITKAGKPINRIQKVGADGHLTGEAINIDWINANERYSWAEGPVMCKRDGWYYYTFARDVAGGQFIYRTRSLSSDFTKWEALGNFFTPITDAGTGFRVSNHMSAPLQIKDGSWWAIAQSYEKTDSEDWTGQGRQTLLHKIDWDANGRPFGNPSTTVPIQLPALPRAEMPWLFPRSDDFTDPATRVSWHYLHPAAARLTSAKTRKGWMQIQGDTGRAHLLQKEAGHYYALVTKVDLEAKIAGQQGGIYLTNGNQSIHVKLGIGKKDGDEIFFSMGTTEYTAVNNIGNTVWLKLDRREHNLRGYFSADGLKWTQLGQVIDATNIDKVQPDYNSWVGTSIGLFAEKGTADFDLFVYKDGFSQLPVAGFNNFFGVQTQAMRDGKAVTNTTDNGGWVMLGGVDLGNKTLPSLGVAVEAASPGGGKLEIWMDDIEGKGKLLATVNISATGNAETYRIFSATALPVSGQHDLYLRFPKKKTAFRLSSIQFIPKSR